MPQLAVVLRKCGNLCCEGCAQLLPMFHNGEEFPAKAIIRDLEIFFRGVDQCIELCVDSEPFIYKELAELLRWLAEEKKVIGVHLNTNSFAQPSKEVLTILSNKKFAVFLSDYGQIKQLGHMISVLEEAGVNFFVQTCQEWGDWGSYESHGRTEMELHNSFMMCDANINCKALCNGAVYTCVRSARLHALGCGYTSERDYFFLSEDDSIEELRSKIRKLFYYMDRADACDRCDAGQSSLKKIAAGKQAGVKRRMSAYTVIRRDEYERLGGMRYKSVDEAVRRSRSMKMSDESSR